MRGYKGPTRQSYPQSYPQGRGAAFRESSLPRRGKPPSVRRMETRETLRPCPFCAHDRPVLAEVGDERVRFVVVTCPECRLPLAPLMEPTKKAVDDALKSVGLLQAKAAE